MYYYYEKKTTQTKKTNQQLQCKPAAIKADLRGAFLEGYCTEKEEISAAPKTISTLSRYEATISLSPTWLLIHQVV